MCVVVVALMFSMVVNALDQEEFQELTLAYYSLDSNLSDISNNGHDLTATGAIEFLPILLNDGVAFTETWNNDNSLDVTDDYVLGYGDKSVCLWFNSSQGTFPNDDNLEILFNQGGGISCAGGGNTMCINLFGNGMLWIYGSDSSSNYLYNYQSSIGEIIDGEIYHVCNIVDITSSINWICLNNVIVHKETLSSDEYPYFVEYERIGSHYGTAKYQSHNTNLDEIALFGGVLGIDGINEDDDCGGDVAQLYNNGMGYNYYSTLLPVQIDVIITSPENYSTFSEITSINLNFTLNENASCSIYTNEIFSETENFISGYNSALIDFSLTPGKLNYINASITCTGNITSTTDTENAIFLVNGPRITPELVAFYRFEENDSLIVKDWGPFNHKGIWQNAYSYTAPKYIYEIGDFNTGNWSGDFFSPNYVAVLNSSNLDFDLDEQFSITLWEKIPYETCPGWQMLAGKWLEASPITGYMIEVREYGWLTFGIFSDVVEYQFMITTTNINLCDSLWHFIAVTYKGNGQFGDVDIYVDGINVTTGMDGNSLAKTIKNIRPFTIGSAYGNDHQVTGQVDEVSVWRGVLNSQEINEIMNGGIDIETPIFIIPDFEALGNFTWNPLVSKTPLNSCGANIIDIALRMFFIILGVLLFALGAWLRRLRPVGYMGALITIIGGVFFVPCQSIVGIFIVIAGIIAGIVLIFEG
jgi:hypothetical protein